MEDDQVEEMATGAYDTVCKDALRNVNHEGTSPSREDTVEDELPQGLAQTIRKRNKRQREKPGIGTRKQPLRGRGNFSSLSLDSAVSELANLIASGKRTVFLTGAGISVASGVPPFRGTSDAVWSESIYQWGTLERFLQCPLEWYNQFWLKHFDETKTSGYLPNSGHDAIARICKQFPSTTSVVTQNIDGLHRTGSGAIPKAQLVEVHGYAGGYKCHTPSCLYSISQVHTFSLKNRISRIKALDGSARSEISGVDDLPHCPSCNCVMAPNCLLFDEDYTDHESYQFDRVQKWLQEADVIVFVGTSFLVRITSFAMTAAGQKTPAAFIFNFNISDHLPANAERAHFFSVKGPSEDTLPQLANKIDEKLAGREKT